jgi:toxin ParE1/3/4
MPPRLFRLTAGARRDLAQISRWIEKESGKRNARAMIERIGRAASTFGTQPHAGVAHPELGPTIRSFPVPPYRVYYKPRAGYVVIMRVIHTRRDLRTAWTRSDDATN